MGISGGFSNRAQKERVQSESVVEHDRAMLTANIVLDTFSIVLSLIPAVYILNNCGTGKG